MFSLPQDEPMASLIPLENEPMLKQKQHHVIDPCLSPIQLVLSFTCFLTPFWERRQSQLTEDISA